MAQDLPDALAELAREAHVSIGTDGALPHVASSPVKARSVAQALTLLLHGTDFIARQVGPTAWRIERRARTLATVTPVARKTELPVTVGAPIVVTATKRPVPLAEIAQDVSVVSFSADRAGRPGDNTEWVAANSDGVTSAGIGAGRNRLFLNGVADSPLNGDSQSTVAVLLDDARLTFAAPDPDIRLVDMERVEILKGPQGTLYGTGALGGIYRLVTHRADPTAFEASFTSGLETVAGGGLGQSGSAVVNLPLARDRVGLRLVAYGAREPGWVDTGERQNSNTGTALGLRAGVGAEIGVWRVDATGFAQWLNSSDTAYVLSSKQTARPVQEREPHDNDLRHTALRAQRAGPVSVLVSTGLTWHEIVEEYDATQGAAGLGVSNPRVLRQEHQYRTWDSELRFWGTAGRIEWLAGATHVEAQQRGERSLVDQSDALTILDGNQRVATESALFGEVTAPLAQHIHLLGGGRLFRSHFEDRRTLPATSSIGRTRYGLTPGVSLSWAPGQGRTLYIRYGSAIRQGGVSIDAGGEAQELQSDELATIELGWRQRLAGGELTTAVYRSRWENLQSDVLLQNGRVGTINAGEAGITGFDIDWTGLIAPATSLTLAGTVQSAMLVRNSSGIDLHDRHLPLVPRRTLRASLDHNWHVGDWSVRGSLLLRYTSGAHLTFDPQIDQPLGQRVDGRAELGFERGGLAIDLVLANVLDNRSDVMPLGNLLRAGTIRQYTPARPRSVLLQVGRRL